VHVRPTTRLRRLLVVLLALLGLLATGSPGLAAPADGRDPGGRHPDATYLALGDSVPFGYRGGEPPEVYADAENLIGYPELVARRLDLDLVNASCPGETTASFTDETAQSNGCQNSLGSDVGYRDRFPLHVDYTGAQLEYAVEVLRENRDVRLVTLQIGANDALICQRTIGCDTPEEGAALAAQVGRNVDRILGALRGEGGYTGRIAVVTYYALDYADPAGVQAIQGLNAALAAAAEAHGAVVADGFAAFAPRALAAGGSSIDAGLVRPDDIHPTRKGHRLLARAVVQAVGH
jgi:lysophospholipase L1-like esterase